MTEGREEERERGKEREQGASDGIWETKWWDWREGKRRRDK